jgi:hypothetical protein
MMSYNTVFHIYHGVLELEFTEIEFPHELDGMVSLPRFWIAQLMVSGQF